jgi:hypothetical protein
MAKAKKPEDSRKAQSDRFAEAARAAECDEDESHFEDRLRTVAKVAPPPKPKTRPASKGRVHKGKTET